MIGIPVPKIQIPYKTNQNSEAQVNCWFARDVRHGDYGGGQEQNHLDPLGTSKLYFQVNSSRKNSIVLIPNMAAFSGGCKPRIATVYDS